MDPAGCKAAGGSLPYDTGSSARAPWRQMGGMGGGRLEREGTYGYL